MSASQNSEEVQPSWELMLPDLLGRCFNALPDRERCRKVPLVCRAFHDSHLSHPPQPKHLSIWEEPLTHSRVQWLLKTCQQIEHLELKVPAKNQNPWCKDPAKDYCLLLQMLESADLSKLQRLKLSGSWAPHAPVAQLFGTPPLGRVRELSLEGWLITEDSGVQDCQSLSCLQSLTSLDVAWVGFQNVAETQAKAMWEALATLKDLKSLSLSPSIQILGRERNTAVKYGSKPFFYESLSLLTQISHLAVEDADVCLDIDDWIHFSFNTVTQLTSLSLIGKCGSYCFEPVSGLTQLQKVWLQADDRAFGDSEEEPPIDFSLLSCLTELGLNGWYGWEMEEILPPNMPALPNLKRLTLCEMGLNCLDDAVCQALTSLTFLDISCNFFEYFPWGISEIKTLLHLDISGNCELFLTDDDVDTLQEMHQAGLQTLEIHDVPQLLERESLSYESSIDFRRLWWGEVLFSPASMDPGCWTEDI